MRRQQHINDSNGSNDSKNEAVASDSVVCVPCWYVCIRKEMGTHPYGISRLLTRSSCRDLCTERTKVLKQGYDMLSWYYHDSHSTNVPITSLLLAPIISAIRNFLIFCSKCCSLSMSRGAPIAHAISVDTSACSPRHFKLP